MTRSLNRMHVVVAGCGPSGLAAAAACCDAGLDVMIIAPDLDQPWTNTYGAWLDELADVGLADATAHRWARAEAWFSETPTVIERAYAQIDGGHLRQMLMARSSAATLVDGRVLACEEHSGAARIELADGRAVDCDVFVDARGAAPGTWRAAQTAWGEVCEATDVPFSHDAMCLMDWRAVGEAHDVPSFLYAMPLGDGRWFFEETVLVAEPPVPPAQLRARLHRRLDAAGVIRGRVLAEERCVIPMDVPLRVPAGRVVAVGAAAGLVHPATGYSVARGFRMAPRVAQAAADLVASGADAIDSRTIMPESERGADVLLRFGAGVLPGWSDDEIRTFFDAFFRIPAPLRDAYLSGDAPVSLLAAAMRAVFGELPWRLRLRLMRAGTARAPELLAALGAGVERTRSDDVVRS